MEETFPEMTRKEVEKDGIREKIGKLPFFAEKRYNLDCLDNVELPHLAHHLLSPEDVASQPFLSPHTHSFSQFHSFQSGRAEFSDWFNHFHCLMKKTQKKHTE